MSCILLQRQKEMVKHLYHECMSLEELLEESVNTLGPDARDILAQVRYLLSNTMLILILLLSPIMFLPRAITHACTGVNAFL